MADATLDPVVASSQSDGNRRITFVPITATNPLSVATLNGTTAKPLTYSFTPDGYNRTPTQAEVPDPRLTLTQTLTRPGKVSETFEVKFVESEDPNSACVILAQGVEGYIVERRGIDNKVAYATGQKVDVIKIIAGVQRPDAPAENGIDTMSQTLFETDQVQRKVALVA